MLDLCSDHRFYRILVSIPVLSASVDDCAVRALDNIPAKRENCLTCWILRRIVSSE